MSEDLDQIAAAYALGIVRGAAREEIALRLDRDAARRAKAEFWQQQFAALDLAAPGGGRYCCAPCRAQLLSRTTTIKATKNALSLKGTCSLAISSLAREIITWR